MSPTDHAAAVRLAVRSEEHRRGDGTAAVGDLQRLCRAAAKDLPANGVGVTVLSEGGDVLPAASSDHISTLLAELQFTLGEGPSFLAHEQKLPVLLPDLSHDSGTAFPSYTSAAVDHGVRAVFAFPMFSGAVHLGALDFYRKEPGHLTAWMLLRASTYADAATDTLLEADADMSALADSMADGTDFRLEVYQAQGMVMVQLGVPPEEAMLRIRAHAFAHGRRVLEVAIDIITRNLVLDADERAT